MLGAKCELPFFGFNVANETLRSKPNILITYTNLSIEGKKQSRHSHRNKKNHIKTVVICDVRIKFALKIIGCLPSSIYALFYSSFACTQHMKPKMYAQESKRIGM